MGSWITRWKDNIDVAYSILVLVKPNTDKHIHPLKLSSLYKLQYLSIVINLFSDKGVVKHKNGIRGRVDI